MHPKAVSSDSPSLCQVTTVVQHAGRDARRQPQPWMVLKSMVLISFALMCYTFYVFVHKVAFPIFKRQDNALGSLSSAIVTLSVFSILWLWMIWGYVRVVVTSPGKATRFIKPSAAPTPYIAPSSGYYPLDTAADDLNVPDPTQTIGGPSYHEIRASQETHPPRPTALEGSPSNDPHQTPISHPHHEAIAVPSLAHSRTADPSSEIASGQPHSHESHPSYAVPNGQLSRSQRQTVMQKQLARRPPSQPLLTPQRRYCHSCSILKPYRAHHCRSCGTCILKFDHHCPWIGQCVGARNHKFFVNFSLATSIFTLYTFIAFLAFNLSADADGRRSWDPQVIVMTAIAGIFWGFTLSITISHILLICKGQSTLESIIISEFKEHEDSRLESLLGRWNIRAKRAKRAEWDAEWGRIGYEGNIWWLGNRRREWEAVMGKNPIGWILPIGRSPTDGLSYPVNPRFDSVGRWLPRSQWPRELQEKH